MPYDVSSSVILAAQRGDRRARRRIFEIYEQPIRVTVARLLHHRGQEEVEDGVQEVFLKLLARLSTFDLRRGVKFSTWFYTLARNHCFDKLKKRRLPTFSMHAVRRGDDETEFEIPSNAAPPDRRTAGLEFREALEEELARLPELQRVVFRSREIEGLSFREIARRLGEPLSTIKSRYYRALTHLREHLARFDPSPAARSDRGDEGAPRRSQDPAAA